MKWVVVSLMFVSAVFASEMVIDLSKTDGALSYGAVGSHYALSEPDVPSLVSLVPIRVKTVNQKAPDGLQHPGADALRVLETFVLAGGGYYQVYLQDIYQTWPYEKNPDNDGDAIPDDYLEKVRESVRKMESSPYRDKVVYVPFNEPDAIWYSGLFWTKKRQEDFFKAWKKVYEEIKKIAPNAKIAGPNTTTYNSKFMRTFLEFCKREGCLPHLITWHELNLLDVEAGHMYYLDYRKIEQELGIDPIPVCVNEYAIGRQLSVPGRLVSWLARFEQSKIDGCLAYWHTAGNFSGLVEGNIPNGAWWLFKTYANMRGELVEANPSYNSLSYLVTLDEESKTVQMILGGENLGELKVSFKNLPKFFKEKVYYEVWEIEWSGYEGIMRAPDLVAKGLAEVEDGSCVVKLKDLREMSAYQVILKERSFGEREPVWKVRIEAENCDHQNCSLLREGGGNNPPFSGGAVVLMNRSDSALRLEFEIPEAGTYLFEIWYVNGSKKTTVYNLTIDQTSYELAFPPTTTQSFVGKVEKYIHLEEGRHAIVISRGQATEAVGIDLVGLKFLSGERMDEDKRVHTCTVQEAIVQGEAVFHEEGVVLREGSSVEFVFVAERDGYHRLRIDANRMEGLALELNRKVSFPLKKNELVVFLQRGVNLIGIRNVSGGTVAVNSLEITSTREYDHLLRVYEAEEGELLGKAKKVISTFASGGAMVTQVGMGEENSLALGVNVPEDGMYAIVFHYSNGETLGTHQYNVNVVDRYAKVEVDGQRHDVYFRYTGGDEAFKTKTLYLPLKKGHHRLVISNPNKKVSPALPSVYAPNLDKIVLAPVFVE